MSNASLSEGATMSAHRAVDCGRLLRERLGDGADVSVRTLIHADGSFHVEAFHTVYRKPTEPHATGPFMREAVTHSNYDDRPDGFTHVVQHFFEGHNDRWYEYELERITPDEVDNE